MFFREKSSGGRSYLQVVESHRENGRVRQRVIATLGRLDVLRESGQLDALLASGVRFSEKVALLGAHGRGEVQPLSTTKTGPGLAFSRLWEETGIKRALEGLLGDRKFEFDVERAVFLSALHRLVAPGSDRAAMSWCRDYALPGVSGLELHHLYRAMAWLGEPLPEEEQEGRTPFAPRCTKDAVEERMFAARRDLFSTLVVAFFDTTSIYFEGAGGETIGRRGHSKDQRPDLPQMVVGLVLDDEGRPICCELWPGNTADVKSLLPVVDRLRKRFGARRVCFVADRGMISETTIASLEEREVEYILGARLRTTTEVKEEVLSRAGRYREVTPERDTAKDPSPLKVKDVRVEGRRYVVCFNAEQARKDRADRRLVVEGLTKTLRKGSKALVGNKGFRKFLKNTKGAFEIDRSKIRDEARLDGKWVLRTNLDAPSEVVALTYKELWRVEALFRTSKSLLETRPIFHKLDETIRGHVFISFLSLVLMRELQDRLRQRGWSEAEWADVLRDLDALQETEVGTEGDKRFVIRSELKGWCGKALQAAGVAIPPTVRQVTMTK